MEFVCEKIFIYLLKMCFLYVVFIGGVALLEKAHNVYYV